MTLRLANAIYRAHCLLCKGWIYPWTPRCFAYHTRCKHAEDAKGAERNGVARRSCGACGQ